MGLPGVTHRDLLILVAAVLFAWGAAVAAGADLAPHNWAVMVAIGWVLLALAHVTWHRI